MKRCPYCAEEIQDAAVFCRFCRKDLTHLGLTALALSWLESQLAPRPPTFGSPEYQARLQLTAMGAPLVRLRPGWALPRATGGVASIFMGALLTGTNGIPVVAGMMALGIGVFAALDGGFIRRLAIGVAVTMLMSVLIVAAAAKIH